MNEIDECCGHPNGVVLTCTHVMGGGKYHYVKGDPTKNKAESFTCIDCLEHQDENDKCLQVVCRGCFVDSRKYFTEVKRNE